MKKTKFYTLLKPDGELVIEIQNGWTDGTYNYYRPNQEKYWYCILPDYGLAVSIGQTIEKARQKVDAIQAEADYDLTTDYAKDMRAAFERLKAAANHNQTNDGKQNNNK